MGDIQAITISYETTAIDILNIETCPEANVPPHTRVNGGSLHHQLIKSE